MLRSNSPPGVVAGTLDSATHAPTDANTRSAVGSTVQKLRSVLTGYRDELNKAADAFQDWEDRWSERQKEIDAHLEVIQTRLNGRPSGPSLTVVRADE